MFFKKGFNFYINASVHVAFSSYVFMRITELYFGLPYNKALDYFVFFGTITGYNFVKYAGVAKLHHRSLTKNLKIIQIFSFICFGLMCYYAIKLSLRTIVFIGFFCLLTFLYAIPFLSGFQKNLRSVGYLKIIIVALVWAGVTVLVPVYDAHKALNLTVYLTALQRFLLILVLILPFEIRDMQYDAISLDTIPRRIGIANTKKLGYVLLIFCLVLEFIITSNTHFKTIFLIVFFSILSLLMRATTKQSKYYSSFWVEAIPIFWYISLVVF
ncbi:hypothetical protein [Tenacibaculum sp. UWU-22]|uniref:hypothetical protein n=1 Tax=Tenacibaculum sp. UWU-22 TaxID=3234187 RepID=UPI0034DAFBFF